MGTALGSKCQTETIIFFRWAKSEIPAEHLSSSFFLFPNVSLFSDRLVLAMGFINIHSEDKW